MTVLCTHCNDIGYINGKKCHYCWVEGVEVSNEYVAKRLGFNSVEEFNAWNDARHIQESQNNDQEPH